MQFSDGEKEYLSVIMKKRNGNVCIKRLQSADKSQQVSENMTPIHDKNFDVIGLIHELERIASADGCLPCAGCRLYPAKNCQEKGCAFIRRGIEFIEMATGESDPKYCKSHSSKTMLRILHTRCSEKKSDRVKQNHKGSQNRVQR